MHLCAKSLFFVPLYFLLLFPIAGLANPSATETRIRPSVIYGNDDRLDLFQVEDQAMLALADSTVALFASRDVEFDGKLGLANLTTSQFGSSFGLCEKEPFFTQPTGAFCSGSLIAPDVIMTAGHCVTSQTDCRNTKFVFGFAITKDGEMPLSVAADEVYSCEKLIARKVENYGGDWALVQLSRPVTGHQPLALNRAGDLRNGAPLVVIGHPSGLPTKVAGGALVRDSSPNGYFVANLDTYGGNSGSAVFNAETGLVEGILVRGESDFIREGSCRVSYVCQDDACRGEDVTKVEEVFEALDKPGKP